MGKLKTSYLLIVLAGLLLVFLGVKYFGSKDRSKTLRTELLNIDSTKVTSIEVYSPEDTVMVTKQNGSWVVDVDGIMKPAVDRTVRSAIATLNGIEPSRLVARNQEKWPEYAVGDEGTIVRVFEGKNNLGSIVIGRFGVEGQRSFHTFVRLEGDDDTYQSDNFMKMSLNTSADDFRNSEIVKLVPDSIQSIRFDYPDSSFQLTKLVSWQASFSGADSTQIARFINSLRNISSRAFYNEAVTASSEISISINTSEGTIDVGAIRNGDEWIITSSANTAEAWSDQVTFEKLFVGPVSLSNTPD